MDVIKENEAGEKMDTWGGNVRMFIYEPSIKDKSKYPWLSTIDIYGDTVFNYLQIPNVNKELEQLKQEDGLPEKVKSEIDKFITYAQQLEQGDLLRFIGD